MKFSINKSLKVKKPEKFLVNKRTEANAKARFDRIKKKGLQSKKPKVGASTTRMLDATGSIVAEGSQAVKELQEEIADNMFAEKKAQQLVEETLSSNSLGAKVVFVVRVRGEHNLPKEVKKVLSTLRLRNANEGCFCRYTESSKKTLDLVAPYVVYGPISDRLIAELIERRGFAKIDGKRIPLSDNTIIENALGGDTGIICLTDLVAEITNPSSDFAKANAFLWPFRLAEKEDGFGRKTLKITKGKSDVGDMGQMMNGVLKSMM